MTEYRARMGEIITGTAADILSAIALGSCVAIIIYDQKTKIAGLAHVALPEQQLIRNHKNMTITDLPGRYADTAVSECILKLKKMGANINRLQAKISGGSRMFGTKGLLGPGLNVGNRNVSAAKVYLKINKIELKAADVGGKNSRTVYFEVQSSKLTIRKGYNIEILHI